jgi:putative FmdB family regulatory protein
MLTYEYRCSACAHEFEMRQSIRDDRLLDCPACARPRLERLISCGSVFQLKGDGWGRDLYAAPKPRGDTPA